MHRPPQRSARRATLTEGSVRGHLVGLTVPMVWGIAAIMGFHLADTWFVSLLGSRELAAMSFTFPVVLTLTSLGIGLMAGTSSVIARRIGSGDEDSARRITSDALLLSMLLALGLAALGLATIEPLFRMLGADDETLPLIVEYMRIWYPGLLVVLPPMAAIGAIRACGDSRGQSAVLISAALANLALDPLLIFGLAGLPRLEMEGAALASVIARAIGLAPGFWLLHVRHGLLDAKPPRLVELWASWRAVLHVAAPAAGTNVIIPMANGVVTALVATHGTAAVAGFGAAFRIEGVALIAYYAMSAIIGPLVGQNLAAGRPARTGEALRLATRFCAASGLALAAVLALGAPWIAAAFTDDPAVAATTVDYLRIVPWSFGAAGVVMVVNAAFNGVGHPLAATGVSLTRIALLYLPLAWAGGMLGGVAGIFAGLCIANLGAGAVAVGWWRRAFAAFGATVAAPAAAGVAR